MIRTYKQADTYLQAGRNKDNRPLPGNSTRLIRMDNDDIAVVYHRTAVVVFHPNGSVSAYHGGWRSKTTADRIEEYTGGRTEGAIYPGWYGSRMVRNGSDDWKLHVGGKAYAVPGRIPAAAMKRQRAGVA